MAVESAADRAMFIADFGESFKLGAAHAYTGTVTAIFDHEYVETENVSGVMPVLTCVATGVASVEVDTFVTRELDQARYAVRVIEPDGTGITKIVLERIF